jgi:hypothetical protein
MVKRPPLGLSAAAQHTVSGLPSRNYGPAAGRQILGGVMADDGTPTNDDTAAAGAGPDGIDPAAPGEAKRVIGRPFQKGQSGNPGGKPRMSDDEQETLRVGVKVAMSSLVKIAKDPKNPHCVDACKALQDRRYGKPVAAVTGADGSPLFPGAPAGVVSPLDRLLASLDAPGTAAGPSGASPPPETESAAPSANGEAERVPPS